jgi:hypothetical protein
MRIRKSLKSSMIYVIFVLLSILFISCVNTSPDTVELKNPPKLIFPPDGVKISSDKNIFFLWTNLENTELYSLYINGECITCDDSSGVMYPNFSTKDNITDNYCVKNLSEVRPEGKYTITWSVRAMGLVNSMSSEAGTFYIEDKHLKKNQPEILIYQKIQKILRQFILM